MSRDRSRDENDQRDGVGGGGGGIGGRGPDLNFGRAFISLKDGLYNGLNNLVWKEKKGGEEKKWSASAPPLLPRGLRTPPNTS